MAATVLSRGVNAPSGSADPQTFSVTLDAGTNRKFVTVCCKDSGATISGVTFDGNACTARLSDTNSGSTGVGIFFYEYDIPDGMGTGSKTVSVDLSTATQNVSNPWWILQDAAAGAPEASDSDEGDTAATSLTLDWTVTAGSVILSGAVNSSGAPNWSISAGDITLRGSQNEDNLTSGYADGAQASAGAKSATWLASASGGFLVVGGVSYAGLVGPTINTQPTAQTARLNGEVNDDTTATFTIAATTSGGALSYDWELETSVGGGVYANVADGSGATWTGQAGTTLVGTFTATTLNGRRVRCNVTDSNGTATSDAVALTVLTGPVLSASSGTTNASGVSTFTLTTDDALTANGEVLVIAVTARGVTEYVTMRPATPP